MPEVIFEIGKNFVTTEKEQPESVLLEEIKRFVKTAKRCGAKTVKFQVHNVEDEIHPDISITSPHFNQDRYSWVKRNSYSPEFWWRVKKICTKEGIEFLATPMSRGAAEILNEEIGVDRWKIGSGDILDFVLLDYVRDTGKPVILSSGMSTLEELKMSYQYLAEKVKEITILHCVSQYPCPTVRLNLGTIPFLRRQFPGVPIGFSDHSLGIQGALMAERLGATIIEKHFTLDKSAWGPDHKASSSPHEMQELMEQLGKPVEMPQGIMGIEDKYLQPEEEQFRPSFRKGLYAARDIQPNEFIDPDMLISLRPQSPFALPSQEYPNFLGKFTKKAISQYQPISYEDISA